MSYLSEFEHTKLEARVYPGVVTHKHYISDPRSGRRRIPKSKVWKVERLLGRGGFGEVRLEVCTEENEQRAVKRIWATGVAFKAQYERELKALLEFSKPKYKDAAVFVEFFGWFEDPESVYLAMEYVPLGDLEENVKAIGGTLKEIEVKDITIQILEGLEIMHRENFVHRDLKPKNVLVCQGSPRWWVKLADFGLSKRQTEETAYRTQTGTQAYMAPEILKYVPGIKPSTSEYTNAVDIWALGCIVYRLSSGVVPFPPGLSLVTFCGDESTFPSQRLALSELGIKFVKDLLMPYPTRRLTAQQALAHTWTRLAFEPPSLDSKQSVFQGIESNMPFGQYNTVTHAGLQSHTVVPPSQNKDFGVVGNGPPKIRYQPPTVEDDNGQSEIVYNANNDMLFNFQEEQLAPQTFHSLQSNLPEQPGDSGSPEATFKPSLNDTKTIKRGKTPAQRWRGQHSISEATDEDVPADPNYFPEQIVYATSLDKTQPTISQNNRTQERPRDKLFRKISRGKLYLLKKTGDDQEYSTSDFDSVSEIGSRDSSGVGDEVKEVASDSELPRRIRYKDAKLTQAKKFNDNFNLSSRSHHLATSGNDTSRIYEDTPPVFVRTQPAALQSLSDWKLIADVTFATNCASDANYPGNEAEAL